MAPFPAHGIPDGQTACAREPYGSVSTMRLGVPDAHVDTPNLESRISDKRSSISATSHDDAAERLRQSSHPGKATVGKPTRTLCNHSVTRMVHGPRLPRIDSFGRVYLIS